MNVHDSISNDLLNEIMKDAKLYINKLHDDFSIHAQDKARLCEILAITDKCVSDYGLVDSLCSDTSCEECWSRALKMGKWKE